MAAYDPLVYLIILVLMLIIRIAFLSAKHEEHEESSPETRGNRRGTEEEEPIVRPGRTLDTCKYCGAAVLIPESKFCWNCGTNLHANNVAAAPPTKGKGRPLKKKCMVCDLKLNSTDEIIHCPHCGNPAHKEHLLEWLHVKRSCPICRNHLDENELKTQLDKHPHRRAKSHSSG